MDLRLRVASLVLGPFLLAASTFFWRDDGRYGVTGGALAALASVVWAYGLFATWDGLREHYPVLARVGLVLATLGVFGGIAFGLQGFFEGIFGVTGVQSLEAAAAYPLASWMVLWGPGPMFPVSLILLGIALFRSGVVPPGCALALAAGGAAFPLSRITRTEVIAHGADLLLLAAFCWLAVVVARDRLAVRRA